MLEGLFYLSVELALLGIFMSRGVRWKASLLGSCLFILDDFCGMGWV